MRATDTGFAVILPVLILAFTAGCSSPATDTSNTPTCLGLVVGQRSNSTRVTEAMLDVLVPRAEDLQVGSTVVVTGISGAASGDYIYSGVIESSDNTYDLADSQVNMRSDVIREASSSTAGSDQADVLGAIESTAHTLARSGLQCEIHVLDSGLQTTGLIPFQQHLLEANPEDIVERVPDSQTLQGMTVVFETLGSVLQPQETLDDESRSNLARIWQGVITKRGGIVRESKQVYRVDQAEAMSGLPAVDTVPIPDGSIDFSDLAKTCTSTGTRWELPGDVLFVPDSDLLKDSAGAVLDPAVTLLTEHSEATVSLIGHTASTGEIPSITQLSTRRAERVKEYLIAQGIAETRINSKGVGDTTPICEDWDPTTGAQIEACASEERRVDLVIGIDGCVD